MLEIEHLSLKILSNFSCILFNTRPPPPPPQRKKKPKKEEGKIEGLSMSFYTYGNYAFF